MDDRNGPDWTFVFFFGLLFFVLFADECSVDLDNDNHEVHVGCDFEEAWKRDEERGCG